MRSTSWWSPRATPGSASASEAVRFRAPFTERGGRASFAQSLFRAASSFLLCWRPRLCPRHMWPKANQIPRGVGKLQCFSCGIESRGYECKRCRLVCCPKCLPSVPLEVDRAPLQYLTSHGHACPQCGRRLTVQKECFVCGGPTLPLLFLLDGPDWHCSECEMRFCPGCAKALPRRDYAWLFWHVSRPACPSCGGGLKERDLSG